MKKPEQCVINGFVLLDTMLAIVVLGSVLVAVIQSIGNVLRINASSGSVALAAAEGQRSLAAAWSAQELPARLHGFSVSKTETPSGEHCLESAFAVRWVAQGTEVTEDFSTARFVKNRHN